MSKIITSSVKRFPGTVTLADPLTYPQLMAWQAALDELADLPTTKTEAGAYYDNPVTAASIRARAVCACIERADLTGVPEHPTADTIPSTPYKSAASLVLWIFGEINALINAPDDDPNA